MNKKEWMEQKLDGLHPDEVTAFAHELREKLRDPARATLWIAKDVASPTGRLAAVTRTASDVATRLRDQSIVPLLELPPTEDPRDRKLRLGRAIDEELTLRRQVIEQIDRLLADKTPLGAAPPRVCDAGYVLMRQIVSFKDVLLEPYSGEAAFYALPEARRDELMATARSTTLWQRLLHGSDDGR